MGSMDRNTVIGFLLLAVLLFLYLFLSTKNSRELEQQKALAQDSSARINQARDSSARLTDTVRNPAGNDTVFQRPAASEQFITVENNVFKINFSNKGGQPKSVELKKYTSDEKKPVVLAGTDFDKISYAVNTGSNQAAQISELYFAPAVIKSNPDSSQQISFQLVLPGGESITHYFLVKPDEYAIDWTVQLNGADKLLTQGAFNLLWQVQPV